MKEKKYTKTDLLELEMKNLIQTNSDDHRDILEKIECISKKLDDAFVTKIEFTPVKNVVYGLVGLLLTSVIVALIRLILIR